MPIPPTATPSDAKTSARADTAGQATHLRVAVVGRSLFLGVISGLFSGAIGAESLTFGSDYVGGGAAIGGLLGMVLGLVFGAAIAPLVLRRASATGGHGSTRDRIAFAACSTVLVLASWALILGGDFNWPKIGAMGISLTIASGSSFTFVSWCMAPLQDVERHATRPICDETLL